LQGIWKLHIKAWIIEPTCIRSFVQSDYFDEYLIGVYIGTHSLLFVVQNSF
jgi:hypothetical protein